MRTHPSSPGEGTTIQSPLVDDPAPVRSRPRIEWNDEAGPHAIALEQRVIAGSAVGSGLVVRDPTVSRLHAELDPRADGVWVRDLGSKNGTYVENILVQQACVPEGGRIRLGSAGLTVRYDAEPAHVELWQSDHFGPLLGCSAAMRELFAVLARIASTESSVLVQGETGTGKELVALALHEASPRAEGPFVTVDCGALAESLLESELFGHAKGAFTGAATARAGAFEAAHGGTVFLDEVGELPLAMQPKLLRVLESRSVRRLGEVAPRSVDMRIVSATHRDLVRMVSAGAFREDLYFRLAVLPVSIPPLRERPTDIPLLVRHFVSRAAGSEAAAGVDVPSLSSLLASRLWFGNVRELRNFVERALALGPDKALAMLGDANVRTGVPDQKADVPNATTATLPISFDQPYKAAREQCLEAFEREYIRTLCARHGRNVAAIAREAEVDRTYVYRLIRRYDL